MYFFIVEYYLKYHTVYFTQQNPVFITEYYLKIALEKLQHIY
jgi:hypothetical protein